MKAVVSVEAKEVETFQKEVQLIADDAKADLAEAMPILEGAVKSLSALNKNDIVEIKSFQKPPTLVQMTMEAVCTLKQEKADWDTAKKILSDSNFMESLKTFDKENVPDAVIKKLKKYASSRQCIHFEIKMFIIRSALCCMYHNKTILFRLTLQIYLLDIRIFSLEFAEAHYGCCH